MVDLCGLCDWGVPHGIKQDRSQERHTQNQGIEGMRAIAATVVRENGKEFHAGMSTGEQVCRIANGLKRIGTPVTLLSGEAVGSCVRPNFIETLHQLCSYALQDK